MRQREQEAEEHRQPEAAKVVVDDELHRMEPLSGAHR